MSNKISDLFERQAKKYAYVTLDSSHVKGVDYNEEIIEAGKNYFRLWLSEMYLTRDIKNFKKLYPVVHSIITLQFGTQQIDIPYVAGSVNLNGVDFSNLDKAIQLNYPLTTLIPFNGGVVELNAGILAVEGDNYLNRFFEVIGELSSMLVVPQLSTALNVAGPIIKGIEGLIDENNLHLLLHQAYVGKGGAGANILKAGYIVAMAAQQSDLDQNKLWIKDGRLLYGDSINESQPFTKNTYMLFRVEIRDEKDDWQGIKYIMDPFKEAITAVLRGEKKKADSLSKMAYIAAATSDDLTEVDKRRIYEYLQKQYKDYELMSEPFVESASDLYVDLPMEVTMSVEEAFKIGKPSFREILEK